MSRSEAITPPAMLGVLGGGQLGWYFALAAHQIGYRTTVLDPDPLAPAGRVADVHLVAAYDDPDALARMATTCAVVTTEFENPPAESLARLAEATVVRPSPEAIATCQDRIAEKQFLADIGVPVGPYMAIRTDDDIDHALDITFPAILKTARLGYDGKGQVVCPAHTDLAEAWCRLDLVPCVLEEQLRLDREISIVLARDVDGHVACYPAAENQHVGGILDVCWAPAQLGPGGQESAEELCTYIANQLDYVGVLAVEMFIVGTDVYVNELAPRPHNSGHYTLDACTTSQFEQQVRAICNLPLGLTAMSVTGAGMANLLGDLWADGEPRWERALSQASAHLHLYGKADPRPGRKMGHITVTSATAMGAGNLARRLRRQVAPG